MTVLSTLAEALTGLDRFVTDARGGRIGGLWPSPRLLPVPQNQPVELSGENRLITYADSVATYPVIFGVWSKLVRNLATTEIGVFEEHTDGTPPTRVYGTDLEQLLREPAPGKGLVDLLQWFFNAYFVEGNGLVGKYREHGPGTPPTNLIPLDWRYMSALAVPGGPVEQWISYQIGDARSIDPSEVVHLAWHAPNGCVIGTSPLHALGVAIRLEDAASRHQSASFDNAVRPSGALVLPRDARTTPEERQEMRDTVEANNQGIDNRFKMMVLSGGMDWKPMSTTAAEAELDGTRQRSQEEVCIAYDVRRGVIAEHIGGRPTPLAEILRDFQRTLAPHAALFEQVIKRQLIDPEPAWRQRRLCVRFDLSTLVRGTFSEEANTAVSLFVNGLTNRNESRGRIGLAELADPESEAVHVPWAQLQPGTDGRSLPATQQD